HRPGERVRLGEGGPQARGDQVEGQIGRVRRVQRARDRSDEEVEDVDAEPGADDVGERRAGGEGRAGGGVAGGRRGGRAGAEDVDHERVGQVGGDAEQGTGRDRPRVRPAV